MKYVIKIGCKSNDSNSYKWGYYNGRTYTYQGEYYVDDFFDISKAKRYASRNNTEKAAEKLHDKCANIDVWLIEEVEE